MGVQFTSAKPVEIQEKTGLHDFLTAQKKHIRNAVTGIDILPLSDKSDWFRIENPETADLIAQKKVILQNHRDIVTATSPEALDGATELLEMMAQYLPENFPKQFQINERILTNQITGDNFDLDNLPDNPMIIASQLVAEDLVILHQDPKDHQYRIRAGAVTFPSGWRLDERLGQSIMEVHTKVPLLNKFIGKKINRFLENLKSEQPFWRVNYLLLGNPDLSQIKGIFKANTNVDRNDPRQLYLRNERQVFQKLPKSGDIVWSLRYYINPLPKLPPIIAGILSKLHLSLPAEFIQGYTNRDKSQEKMIINFLELKAKEPQK